MELPSQFMENWCYDEKTLFGFARHYASGEPLPRELFDKVRAAKNFQAGLAMVRQLFFGAMDMELHSERFDPNSASKTVFDVQHELARRFAVIPPLPEDRFLCAFSHKVTARATIATSGQRSCQRTRSPPSRRQGYTTRSRYVLPAAASETLCYHLGEARRPWKSSRLSEEENHHPRHC